MFSLSSSWGGAVIRIKRIRTRQSHISEIQGRRSEDCGADRDQSHDTASIIRAIGGLSAETSKFGEHARVPDNTYIQISVIVRQSIVEGFLSFARLSKEFICSATELELSAGEGEYLLLPAMLAAKDTCAGYAAKKTQIVVLASSCSPQFFQSSPSRSYF